MNKCMYYKCPNDGIFVMLDDSGYCHIHILHYYNFMTWCITNLMK